MKNSITLFAFLVLLFCNSCSEPFSGSLSNSDCEDTNCADYNSRLDAQNDFDLNPECRADLDGDNDGKACEDNYWTDYYSSINNNSGGNIGCPTTSNCGCSGINKDPCQNHSCCRWIVGTGCRCK